MNNLSRFVVSRHQADLGPAIDFIETLLRLAEYRCKKPANSQLKKEVNQLHAYLRHRHRRLKAAILPARLSSRELRLLRDAVAARS